MARIVVDCKGMPCPMPIVKLSAAIKEAEQGDEIEITTNDAGFELDVQSWVKTTGHELVSLENQGGTFVALVRKV